MAILRRTERAMVRSMCGVKLVDRKNMEKLMEILGLKEALDRMAKANGVRWCGLVIKRDDDNILKKAMMLEVNGHQKRGRPKITWRRQVEENVKKVGLKIEEAADRTKWREGVRAIAERMRCIRPSSVTREKLDDDDCDERQRRFKKMLNCKFIKLCLVINSQKTCLL